MKDYQPVHIPRATNIRRLTLASILLLFVLQALELSLLGILAVLPVLGRIVECGGLYSQAGFCPW